MRTTKVDEIIALEADWEYATEGKHSLRRSIAGLDRTDHDCYLILAFFDDFNWKNQMRLKGCCAVQSRHSVAGAEKSRRGHFGGSDVAKSSPRVSHRPSSSSSATPSTLT